MKDNTKTGSVTTETPKEMAFPPLRFDPQAYMDYVKDAGLTKAEALELMNAIWVIMTSFVDLRFGIHPIQQAQEAREKSGSGNQVSNDAATLDHESALMLSCKNAFTNNTKRKAARRPRARSMGESRAGKQDS